MDPSRMELCRVPPSPPGTKRKHIKLPHPSGHNGFNVVYLQLLFECEVFSGRIQLVKELLSPVKKGKVFYA